MLTIVNEQKKGVLMWDEFFGDVQKQDVLTVDQVYTQFYVTYGEYNAGTPAGQCYSVSYELSVANALRDIQDGFFRVITIAAPGKKTVKIELV